MKKPWLAFLLSFLIVGAGLAYLGKWGLAAANFFIAVALAIPAISAVLAMNAAKAMNQKSQLQPAAPPA